MWAWRQMWMSSMFHLANKCTKGVKFHFFQKQRSLLIEATISKYPWFFCFNQQRSANIHEKMRKTFFLAIKYPWKYIGLLMAKKYIPLSVLKPIFYNRFKQDITWSWFFFSKYIKTDLKWFFFFFNLIKKGQKLLFCNSVFHQTLDPSEF